MSSVPPPGSLQASTSATDPNASANSLSWEGDKMFNIYIYDYCYKRGYKKTARELLQEAEIPPESHPPIDARQGLLFEWWSVFWVLFTAKANGSGPDEAMIYTQHQTQQARERAARLPSAAGTAMPGQPGPGVPQQQPRPGMNGVPPGQRPFMPNGPGPMPNGVGPNALQPGGNPAPFPPQMNGIPPGQGPSAAPNSQPGQPPNFQGQPRPNQIGGGAPGAGPRPPNGLGPFQSPTMNAHSPQNGGAPGQPQPPQNQPGPQQNQQHSQSMNQLGPSPQMGVRGGMMPPNAGMAPGQQAPGQTPTQAFQQLRPPSRAASPGQGNLMTQPSPSMGPRQPPNLGPPDQIVFADISRLPPPQLEVLKREAGVDLSKELQALNPDEKTRLINTHRARAKRVGMPSTATGLAAGSAGSSTTMLPPNRAIGPPVPGPGRPSKRGSTAGEEPENPSSGSPPDNKRPRRSPMDNNMNYPHASGMSQPGQPGGPGGPGPQQQPGMGPMSNGLRPGMPGAPPMTGAFPGMGQQMGGPMGGMNMGMAGNSGMGGNGMGQSPVGGGPQHQMNNAMSPAMGGAMSGPNSMMNTPTMPNMGIQNQYRQSLTMFHKAAMPPGGVAAGSPSAEPSFGGNMSGQVRPGGPPFDANRGKPPLMGMLPPPSPGMNKDLKDGKPDGSPHNVPNAGRTSTTGSAAPTPNTNPGNPAPPLHQQPGGPSQGPTPNPSQSMAPSPTSMLGNSAPMASIGPPPQQPSVGSQSDLSNMFTTDFLDGTLDGFDGNLFASDGRDINFERDFGQWFNPDDVGSTLTDMK